MSICTHKSTLDIEKLCLKLNKASLTVILNQNSVNSSTLYCDQCEIGLPNIWICLKVKKIQETCKFIGCGRMQNKHAQIHYSSSKHSLFFNPKTGLVWCLDCEVEVNDDNFALFRAIFGVNDKEKVGKAKVKGAVGLKNLGNTCYLNSSLQCLSHVHGFSRFFAKVVQMEEIKARESEDFLLISTLAGLFREMWAGEVSQVNPKEFVQAFRSACSYFQGMAQHDAQEFLRLFLDKLHESLKFEYDVGKFRSIVSDVFKSEIQSKITCTICGYSATKTEDYYDISLSIPSSKEIESYKVYSEDVMSPQERVSFYSEKQTLWNKIQQVFAENKNNVSIYDCLLNFCLPEEINSESTCERCKKKTITKKEVKISKPANTLVLLIKRFKYNKAGVKLSTFIQFPATIDLRFFLSKASSSQYQLTGMIQHSGGLSGGHYISYNKNYKNNRWYEFDDSRVTSLNLSQILEKEAYILFYQRKIDEPREKPRLSSTSTLLPSYFLNLYQTVSDPGPLSISHLICPHNNIRPQYSLSSFLKLSSSQDNNIRQKFNPDHPPLASLSECESCLLDFTGICVRAEMELELINELNSIEIFEGPWYLISTKWLDNWKSFCKLESFNRLPGPIDNKILLKKGKPRKNLEKGEDYRAVNRHVWEIFKALYGGGPEIMRLKAEIYDEPVNSWTCETPALDEEHKRKVEIIRNLKIN